MKPEEELAILEKDRKDIDNGMPIKEKAEEIERDFNKHLKELVALVGR